MFLMSFIYIYSAKIERAERERGTTFGGERKNMVTSFIAYINQMTADDINGDSNVKSQTEAMQAGSTVAQMKINKNKV